MANIIASPITRVNPSEGMLINNDYIIMPEGTTDDLLYYYNPDIGSYTILNEQSLDFADNNHFQVGSV